MVAVCPLLTISLHLCSTLAAVLSPWLISDGMCERTCAARSPPACSPLPPPHQLYLEKQHDLSLDVACAGVRSAARATSHQSRSSQQMPNRSWFCKDSVLVEDADVLTSVFLLEMALRIGASLLVTFWMGSIEPAFPACCQPVRVLLQTFLPSGSPTWIRITESQNH